MFAGVILLALAPRLWCFARNQLPEGDAGNYLEVGHNLALGRGYVTYAKWDFYGPTASVVHPEGNRQPFLPLVVAATFRAGAASPTAARAVTLLASLAALALLYACLRRWFGAPVALAGAALVAVEPAFLWFSVRVQTEVYFTLLFLAALWAAGDFREEKPSYVRPLAVGVLLSLSYLCRVNGFLLLAAYVAALIIIYGRRGVVAGAAALAAFAVVAAPWWVRNARVFGDPFYSQAKYFVLAPTFDAVWAYRRSVPTWDSFFETYGVVGFLARYARGLWRAVEPLLLGNLHFREPYQGAPAALFVAFAFFARPALKRARAWLFPGLALALHILVFALYGQGLFRYFVPFYVLLLPVGLAGAWAAASFMSDRPARARVALLAVLALILVRPLGKTLAADDRREYRAVRAVSEWIKSNVPPGAVVVSWPRVCGLLYDYDRPTLFWPSGPLHDALYVLCEYDARYAVVEPETVRLRSGLRAIWTVGPTGLAKVSPPVSEGKLVVTRADYGADAFIFSYRPEDADVLVYEVDQTQLRRMLYYTYVTGVR